uniref:AXH domain-containing protein n=1 Tax=Panagrolaimus superbus TaxID=310955 RepID=A0A914XVX9_9BILA
MDIDGQAALGSMTASAEYPFYEIESGWSSYDPFKTLNLYGLKCKKIEIGDKCILLSKDFVDKDDSELKKKWQKQFKGQFKGYSKTQPTLAGATAPNDDEIKDFPMELQQQQQHQQLHHQRSSHNNNGNNHGQNRLVRKSIPPPLAMSKFDL